MIQITSGNVCVTKSTFLKTAHKDKKTKDFFIWLFARGRGRGFLTDSSLGSCFTMFFNREMVGFLAVRRMSSTILSPRSSRPLARIPTLITPFSSRDELSGLLETREKKRKKKIKDKRFTIKVCMKSTLRSSNTFNFFFFFTLCHLLQQRHWQQLCSPPAGSQTPTSVLSQCGRQSSAQPAARLLLGRWWSVWPWCDDHPVSRGDARTTVGTIDARTSGVKSEDSFVSTVIVFCFKSHQ